jgi:hypothetical protein
LTIGGQYPRAIEIATSGRWQKFRNDSCILKGKKMMNSILPGLALFGILLAISVFGLVQSNAAAARLNGSGPSNDGPTGRRDDTLRMSGTQP